MNKSRIVTLLLMSLLVCVIAPVQVAAQVSVRVSWVDSDGERGSKRLVVGDDVLISWKDGRKAVADLVGKIAKIDKTRKYILLDKGNDKTQFIPFDSIKGIRDADVQDDPDSKTDDRKDETDDRDDSGDSASIQKRADLSNDVDDDEFDPAKTGIFVLPMSGTVGVEFRPEEIEEIVRQADARGDGQVIVLELDSGGGLVAEGMIIKEVLFDACKRHRIVAWIDKAVSCASWTALCCDEIVFKQHGYTGGITIMIGRQTAPEATVRNWLRSLEDVLKAKNRSTYWAKPFVLEDSFLSATKDPDTGSIKWFNDTSGDTQLSGRGENLYFNADSALEWNLSIGTANTPDELAEVLKLSDWQLAGNGQELHDNRIKQRDAITDRYQKQMRTFQRSGNDARGIRKKIMLLKSWKLIWKTNPNIARMTLSLPSPDVLDQQIEKLENALREM